VREISEGGFGEPLSSILQGLEEPLTPASPARGEGDYGKEFGYRKEIWI